MHIERLNGGFAPPAARLPPQCFSCFFHDLFALLKKVRIFVLVNWIRNNKPIL